MSCQAAKLKVKCNLGEGVVGGNPSHMVQTGGLVQPLLTLAQHDFY